MKSLNNFKQEALTTQELKKLNGGDVGTIDPGEGATLILALGAMGGPATFAFALPIAVSLYLLD